MVPYNGKKFGVYAKQKFSSSYKFSKWQPTRRFPSFPLLALWLFKKLTLATPLSFFSPSSFFFFLIRTKR